MAIHWGDSSLEGEGGGIMVILDDLSEVACLIIYNNIKLISYFL